MPFDSAFDDIYKLGIKASAEELGCYCERVDEQIFEERILDRIYNQIDKADILIADLTGKNANVFYEIGYAHALKKKVILLTQYVDDIPFDLRHHPHIIYGGKITNLKGELKKRIKWLIDHSSVSEIPPNSNLLKFFIEGHDLQNESSLHLERSFLLFSALPYKRTFSLKLDIHNPLSSLYKSNFKIGLLTQNIFDTSSGSSEVIPMPNGAYLHLSEKLSEIYPECWISVTFALTMTDGVLEDDFWKHKHIFKLKIFDELSTYEIPFEISLKQTYREFGKL